MFNFLKKKEASKPINPRDMLFGDMPLSEWAKEDAQAEPWLTFLKAAARKR